MRSDIDYKSNLLRRLTAYRVVPATGDELGRKAAFDRARDQQQSPHRGTSGPEQIDHEAAEVKGTQRPSSNAQPHGEAKEDQGNQPATVFGSKRSSDRRKSSKR